MGCRTRRPQLFHSAARGSPEPSSSPLLHACPDTRARQRTEGTCLCTREQVQNSTFCTGDVQVTKGLPLALPGPPGRWEHSDVLPLSLPPQGCPWLPASPQPRWSFVTTIRGGVWREQENEDSLQHKTPLALDHQQLPPTRGDAFSPVDLGEECGARGRVIRTAAAGGRSGWGRRAWWRRHGPSWGSGWRFSPFCGYRTL